MRTLNNNNNNAYIFDGTEPRQSVIRIKPSNVCNVITYYIPNASRILVAFYWLLRRITCYATWNISTTSIDYVQVYSLYYYIIYNNNNIIVVIRIICDIACTLCVRTDKQTNEYNAPVYREKYIYSNQFQLFVDILLLLYIRAYNTRINHNDNKPCRVSPRSVCLLRFL